MMRNTFPGYYRPSVEEFSELWDECLFILDANVLLNLYRYSPETSEELLDILKQIQTRLWIPHQAALEYQENRLTVISRQYKAYENILKTFAKIQRQLDSNLNEYNRHPFVDINSLLERVNKLFSDIERELEDQQGSHPDLLKADPLRDKLTDLLDGKVGPAYSVSIGCISTQNAGLRSPLNIA